MLNHILMKIIANRSYTISSSLSLVVVRLAQALHNVNVRSFIWSPQKDLRKVPIQTVSPLNSLLCFDSCNAWIVCCLNYVADGRIFL